MSETNSQKPLDNPDSRARAGSPIAQAIAMAGGDFLMTAQPSSHKALYDFMQGAMIEERTVTHKVASKRLTYR